MSTSRQHRRPKLRIDAPKAVFRGGGRLGKTISQKENIAMVFRRAPAYNVEEKQDFRKMFWKFKSPLAVDDEEWQIECWRWLLDNFGGIETLRDNQLILPTAEFFPGTDFAGHKKAQHIFSLVARHMSLSPDQFELTPQESSVDPLLGGLMVVQNAPASPGGTFRFQAQAKPSISYDPALLSNPVTLISVFAYELCHPLLLSTAKQPPGGDDCEEYATDLAVTYFGFGVFGANSAFEFEQHSDVASGTQGWSTRRMGYLTEAEWGFSLAMFSLLTDQPAKNASQHLKESVSRTVIKSMKYLEENTHVYEALTAPTNY